MVRAVARKGFALGWEVFGVADGFRGLITQRFSPLDDRGVGGILHRGGTILGTARAPEFETAAGQSAAVEAIERAGIGGLAVVGGEGSLKGALRLEELGVDTALNTALEAIDRIKDTASSHRRAHVVEVMGRRCGHLALTSAVAGGAEAVLLPEFEPSPEEIVAALESSYERGKPHFIVVAAEGARPSAREFHEYVNGMHGTFESRLTVLGHVQRGGSPTAYDRLLSSRLGAAAVEALAGGSSGIMVGVSGGRRVTFALAEVATLTRSLDEKTYELALTLSGLRREQGR
ncbi:MAG: 6-phosphofructokinase [Rubrobacteraceae bacterium]|nr:6-phosphofructokinase [Rubrobacteraceae bacterium]